ncbi:MAG TPA: hypothetical protein VFA68_14705 [Terriglobales bacterium]|nr:hypothetical protein [Terriglobales bacterium]
MAASPTAGKHARWYLIPLRVLLVTVLFTLAGFAVSLLLGIIGLVAGARLRGHTPNMTLAYREIAIPTAAVVGSIVLVSSVFLEIRHYRQAKALAQIEKASQ